MRFLILSDIYANSTALDAALAAAEGRWERVLCLGDVVDYGPDPNEVTERVKALAPFIIRGNHDKVVAGLSDIEAFNPVAQIAARWTGTQLNPENMQYIAQLPTGPAHTDGRTMGGLMDSPSDVTLFGHTHYQGGFAYRAGQINVIQLRPDPGANFAALRL